jgi:hypothetical protein
MPLINDETNNESDEESNDENEEVIIENEIDNTVDKKQKSTYKTIKSACGSDIIIKKRNNRSKSPPIILYEEDLYGETEPTQIIVKKKKTKGRPKKKTQLIEYINDNGEVVDKDDINTSQVIINKPEKQKLSAKDLKMIELQQQILQLETVSNKKIRGTRKGQIDKRQTTAPTEKQINARKKFVENNRLRNEAKKAEKLKQSNLSKKEDVKLVVGELQELKKQSLIEKNKADLLKEQIKQELLEEQQAKQPKIVKNTYDNFM